MNLHEVSVVFIRFLSHISLINRSVGDLKGEFSSHMMKSVVNTEELKRLRMLIDGRSKD